MEKNSTDDSNDDENKNLLNTEIFRSLDAQDAFQKVPYSFFSKSKKVLIMCRKVINSLKLVNVDIQIDESKI
jgi:hypothetical protein